MKCYICDKDNWHKLEFKLEREMIVCKECGNLCYRMEGEDGEKLKEFYRKEYRENKPPSIINLITTNHKLNYFKMWLGDILSKNKGWKIGDVGCATGYAVAWFRQVGHRATGCEMQLPYRRFAEHFYGCPITEELEVKHKYKLISIYHVLEHLVEPDKKLLHYMGLLEDDGYMFISTPYWLGQLEEPSGTKVGNFQNYFHSNHIDIFSIQSLKNLFIKVGLVIIKEDCWQYGQTYLLRKRKKEDKVESIVKESWEEVEKKLRLIKKAIELYDEGKFRESIDVYFEHPQAWAKLIYTTYAKDSQTQKSAFDEAFTKESLSNTPRMLVTFASWLYQQGDYAKALDVYLKMLDIKPNEDSLMYTGYCYAHLGKHQESMQAFYKAQEMNPQKWTEAMGWVCREASLLPSWEERALMHMKEKMVEKSGYKPVLKDEFMEKEMPEKGETATWG